MSHKALIFNAAHSARFTDAVVLGQGLPMEKNGQPVRYFWKEVLRSGRYVDKHGQPFEITPQRIDNLIANFNRAKSKGWLPHVPCRHEFSCGRGGPPDPRDNLGFVVDARKSQAGSLELLHQIIGDEAAAVVARNKSSIGTLPNVTDEHGETYDEFLDHNAIVPDPHIGGLGDFTPAIAASRGHAIDAVVLETAAEPPNKESTVDLKALRKAIGAADDVTDEKVIESAAARLTEAVPALELSRTQGTTIATLTTERDAVKAERDAARARVLELSRGAVTDDVLPREVDFAKRQIDLALAQGRCSKPAADYLTSVVERDGKPAPAAALMLSRTGPDGSPIDVALKLLELNRGLAGFQQTEAQPVGRTVPGGTPEDKPITPARKAELLAHVGA